MKKNILLASIAFLLIACQSKQTKNESEEVEKVENSHYQPAFSGQTRAKEIVTQTPYSVDVITENLGLAWAVTNLPNNKLLVTNKEKAEMFVIDLANPENPKKVTGFPEINLTTQGGMLDVIADPDFENNRIIYWTYAEPLHDEQKNDRTAIAKGKLAENETKIENIEVIYRTFPVSNSGLHYGNRLAFDNEGYLYVSFGERSNADMRKFSQDLSSPLGKVLRLTKDGKPAPNNPFSTTPDALPEIYSLGHRNPQSLAFDTNDQLWEIEHGPKGGDELNLIKPGKNYGWPIITYGVEYYDEVIGDAITQQKGLEQPVYYWDPVIAPSGAEFYTGNIEEWKGNLFVGGLKTQLLGRLIIENNKVVGEEHLLKEQNDRIRDMVTGADGNLYVVGDQGKLYRISKKIK